MSDEYDDIMLGALEAQRMTEGYREGCEKCRGSGIIYMRKIGHTKCGECNHE